MLVLSRKKNESIVINNEIAVTVLRIRGNNVSIGIDAPGEIPVYRQEVVESMMSNADQQNLKFDTNDRNLLVVSNDRGTRSTLANLLADQGGDVDIATTSACAMEFVGEKEYEVAIIDESLPKMRGQELFERIKSWQTDLKGILCSNRPNIDTVETAIDSGMRHVVQKPVDEAEILPLLNV